MKYYYLIILLLIIYFIFILKNNKFYKNIKLIKNPDSILVLVNKNNKLDSKYKPKDLEVIDLKYSNKDKYLRKEAKEAFEKLSDDASKLNLSIIAVSTFRSYSYQKNLYLDYVNKKGKEYADLCSARPGHSEHQTGLSLDVMGSNKDYNKFDESKEFNWMINNAYKYGFILRYPKGKEHITGFKYEPWHYRYVGKEPAKIIHDNNITLEEYKKTR